MFVDLRKRFVADQINEINETIMGLVREEVKDKKEESPSNNNISDVDSSELKPTNESTNESTDEPTEATAQENPVVAPQNRGDLIVSLSAH